MDNPDFTLEDLHDDNNPEVTKPEHVFNADKEVVDDPPTPDPAPVADPPEPVDPPAKPVDPPEPEEPSPATGLELFLSQYDIEGGMITYDDGTSTHISELPAEEQVKILSSVANDSRPSVEDQYDLDQEEINLLNELRNSKKTAKEYIDTLAKDRFSAYKADSDSRNVDYKSMDNDAVYVKFLKTQKEDITESEIEEGLNIAKENPTYETLVEGLRKNMIFAQDKSIEDADTLASKEVSVELEQDRQAIVDAATKIKEIGGFEIPREVTNDVLHDLLEVNEYGDSLFLEKTFSDPNTMFKTAWFSKYGEDYLSDIENYYKQEVTKAYKRGQEAVSNGLPSKPRSISSGSDAPKGGKDYFDPDDAAPMDLEDLHDSTD